MPAGLNTVLFAFKVTSNARNAAESLTKTPMRICWKRLVTGPSKMGPEPDRQGDCGGSGAVVTSARQMRPDGDAWALSTNAGTTMRPHMIMRTSGKSRIFKLSIQTVNGDAALTRTTRVKKVISESNIKIPGAR